MPIVASDNFNDALPASLIGRMNAKWLADLPTVVPRNISANVPNFGNVDARITTTEVITDASQGKLVTLNNASAVAVTVGNTTGIAALGGLALNAGGSGYAVGDTFSIGGAGTGANGVVIAVAAGVVTQLALTVEGTGYATATGVSTTALTGTGTGLTVNILTVVTGFQTGFVCWISNIGNGVATLTPATGTWDGGLTTVVLNKYQSIGVYWDGTNLNSERGLGTPAALIQNEGYTFSATDTGAANAYACALTPAVTVYTAGLDVSFIAAHANTGASTLAVNGLAAKNIYKSSGGTLVALTGGEIIAGQIVKVKYDGTQFQMLGGAGGGGFTAGGDLSGTSTLQEVVGILNTLFDSPGTAWADGQTIEYSATSGKLERLVDRPVFIVSAKPGQPTSGQDVCIYVAAASMTFPANFATPNSYGSAGTNPTSTATYTCYKNGSSVGTIVISTSGVFTFSTAGGASFNLNAGDRFTIVAPGSVDATLADVGITLVGTRTATVPAVLGQGIFIWRGTYNPATTYNINDVVAYTVSGAVQSYISLVGSNVGNPPNSSPTDWALMAQAGGSGSTSATPFQQQSYTYALDAGSANAYSVTQSPAPNVVDGSVAVFRVAHTNTGASTLTLPGDTGATGGAAKNIVKQGGTAVAAGDLTAHQAIIVFWDNANSNWEMIGGGGGDTVAKYLIGATDATLTNAIVWPGITTSVDVPPTSPTAFDDEFDAGAFNTTLWNTTINIGSVTVGQAHSMVSLVGPTNGTTHSLRGYCQALPSAPWGFVLKINALWIDPITANFGGGGPFLYESSTTKCFHWYWQYSTPWALIGARYTNPTTETTQAYSQNAAYPVNMGPVYMRISQSGSTLSFAYSFDMINWTTPYTEATNASFTTAPNYIGFALDPYSQKTIMSCDFFRRTI